ncbi:hypothetical protein F0185_12025 [Massilia sp. CCM 8692]|uniref:Uncharacterized protein n=1 Tax=Massilia rubra TaxID=2607910 RepID=A0ABX0LJG5_9BURK|nr:hypothetical protein [Massilia rubra]
MFEIKALWSTIRPDLKQDLEKTEFIDIKLQEAFRAFDMGDNEVGRDALWDVYNSGIRTLC